MVRIEAGSFRMGSDSAEADEAPVHTVELSRNYFIGTTEVTRGEYLLFCENTGRSMPGNRGADNWKKPVIGVEWTEAIAYCNWLSEKFGYVKCYSGVRTRIECDFDASGFRLPTEAEWEYAAQGTIPEETGHYGDLSGGGPLSVASLPPNSRGLYDMAGNSFEWCWDWYDAEYYQHSPTRDPAGPELPGNVNTPRGPEKARRSGSWRENRDSVLSYSRSYDNIYYAGDNGFRLVRTAP